MELNRPIAAGLTAEIYDWKPGFVLKLFNQGISRTTVEYEAGVTKTVHESGLPVPAAGEIIDIEGRFGLELEKLEGPSMLEEFARTPWKFIAFAHQLAELQADMHTRQLPGLPSLADRLRRKITHAMQLPEHIRRAALEAVNDLPAGNNLCHGDFHPGNILLTQRGAVIIDWIDATHGMPILDVARSTLLFGYGPIPPSIPAARLISALRGSFYQAYRRRYFRLKPVNAAELQEWIPVLAAARLSENTRYDEEHLLQLASRLKNKVSPH